MPQVVQVLQVVLVVHHFLVILIVLVLPVVHQILVILVVLVLPVVLTLLVVLGLLLVLVLVEILKKSETDKVKIEIFDNLNFAFANLQFINQSIQITTFQQAVVDNVV